MINSPNVQDIISKCSTLGILVNIDEHTFIKSAPGVFLFQGYSKKYNIMLRLLAYNLGSLTNVEIYGREFR